MITRGTYCSPLRSLRKKRFAAFLLRRLCDPYIQHVAVLIHCSPQIVPLSTDCEKDLIQVPLVPTPRAAPAEVLCVRLPKLQPPLTYGFIGHNIPALCVVRSSTSRKLSDTRK